MLADTLEKKVSKQNLSTSQSKRGREKCSGGRGARMQQTFVSDRHVWRALMLRGEGPSGPPYKVGPAKHGSVQHQRRHHTYHHVVKSHGTAAVAVYMSLLPHPSLADISQIKVHSRVQTAPQLASSSRSSTHTIRAVANWLPPPRLAANCIVQLPTRQEDGRPIPPAHRRHRPEAHRARCRTAPL